MLKKIFYVLMAASVLAITGCAEGTSMYETPGAMSAPPSGMGRIVVYRSAGFVGSAVQPVIKVGQTETGNCTPNGVFLVDVPAGEYFVSATTEISRSVLVDLDAGEIVYVKCEIGMGFFVGQPELSLMEASIGRGESASLALTGTF